MIAIAYLTIVGGACGLFGLYLLSRRVALLLTGNRAAGEFVRFERRHRHFYPVVKFEAHDGQTYEFVGGAGHSRQPPIARKYTVLYPPHAPTQAMLYGLLNYWAAPIAFLILSAGAIVAAVQQ